MSGEERRGRDLPHGPFYEKQRAWALQLGLLGRPWLVLGGAPNPTLPAEFFRGHARIDINNSGLTAFNMGLPPADLTLRRAKANWQAWPDFTTRGLIWFTATPAPLLWLRLLTKHRRAKVETLMRMSKRDRTMIVDRFVGSEIAKVGDQGKPSNGVVAVCYGLYLDIPEIVLAGVSLTRSGHSYDQLGRPRKQIEEDDYALRKLAKNPRVATTEAELASLTGMRLWLPPA